MFDVANLGSLVSFVMLKFWAVLNILGEFRLASYGVCEAIFVSRSRFCEFSFAFLVLYFEFLLEGCSLREFC